MKIIKNMQKSMNPNTGVVHGLTGKKVGPLQMHETVCGVRTLLHWTKAPTEKVTCAKCRSELPTEIPQNCCLSMDYYLNMKCEQHPDPFDCPDNVICYSKKLKKWGLIIHDGSQSYYQIFYCPWCAKKLTPQ